MTDRHLEGYCGLYCGACPVHERHREDPVVRAMRERFDVGDDQPLCQGCRSDVLWVSCRDCEIRDCAQSKELDSCSKCLEMPCDRLTELRAVRPHLVEIVPNLNRLRDRGSEAWVAEQENHWHCPSCERAATWYEQVCGACGASLAAGYALPEDN
jgi:hypothetical protein